MTRGSIVVLVFTIVVALGVIFAPDIAREYGHWQHYRQLEREGEYRAEFADLILPSSGEAGKTIDGRVAVKNIGTKDWPPGTPYFAIGIYEQSKAEGGGNFKFTDNDFATDRVVIKREVSPQMVLVSDFQLVLPKQPGKYTLHFQMVWEDVTWFGQTKKVAINVR